MASQVFLEIKQKRSARNFTFLVPYELRIEKTDHVPDYLKKPPRNFAN